MLKCTKFTINQTSTRHDAPFADKRCLKTERADLAMKRRNGRNRIQVF